MLKVLLLVIRLVVLRAINVPGSHNNFTDITIGDSELDPAIDVTGKDNVFSPVTLDNVTGSGFDVPGDNNNFTNVTIKDSELRPAINVPGNNNSFVVAGLDNVTGSGIDVSGNDNNFTNITTANSNLNPVIKDTGNNNKFNDIYSNDIDATASDAVAGDTPVVINVKTDKRDGEVYVTVDGKEYVGKVNPDGTATIIIPDFKEGKYAERVYYRNNDSGEKYHSYDEVNFTVAPNLADIIHDNAYVDYSSNYAYRVRFIGVDGKAVGAGVIVTVNGKTYKTDSNGYITIMIGKSYASGKYKITLSYKGVTSSKTITVKKILKVKTVKKSNKKIVLRATLKLSKANKFVNKKAYSKKSALKNKKITVKFKGKTYKIKTNKKGIAKFTISKKMLNKLKSGKKYKVVFKYGKDIVNRYVKIKR